MRSFNSPEDIKKMIKRYVAGKATPEEIEFVETYYNYQERQDVQEFSTEELEQLRKQTFENISSRLNSGNTKSEKQTTRLYIYSSVAAAVLLALTFVILLQVNSDKDRKKQLSSLNKPLDIRPGSNRATLTLADGTKIDLDDKAEGKLKETPGLLISKTSKGELIYIVTADKNTAGNKGSNTVSTPKGGQYQVVLPDGTRVWLNAASALTYPLSFSGGQRRVQLEGEGYFEVAKNKAMPFHVISGDQDVEVTGTHFNVNGYKDNGSVNTTLLEGGVTVHSLGGDQKIRPGEQAMVRDGTAKIRVRTVDTAEETAWKNGFFEFNNSSLKVILNQLERWYDIRVDYQNLPAKRYNGTISRNVRLSQVLNMLEVTGNIRFKIQKGRQLKVSGN